MAKKKKEKLTEEFLVSHAQDVYRRSKLWREQEVESRWENNNDLYDSKFTRKEREQSNVLLGQGRLFIPKTYSHTQRMLVDILDTFFSDSEEIVNIASWKNVDSDTREIVKTLLNYRLNSNPIDFYQEAYEACLDALKNKIGIFKVYPELDTETVDGEEQIKKYVPVIECLPYEDVFFDQLATWKDYWKYPIIHRMIKTKDYLKKQGYKNLDLIQPANDFMGGDLIKTQRTDNNGSPFMYAVEGQNDKVWIYDIWTYLDIDGDGLLESVNYVMAGEGTEPKIIIRDVKENELPYGGDGPFVAGQAFPEAHQLYGKSMPEITEGLQKETNALRNQRREAVALSLRRPILVQRGANVDLMGLVNRRVGGVVQADDVSTSAIRELEIQDPTMSSVQEQARTDQDFYETTSIPPNLMGMPSSADETATATTMHTTNANKKIAQIIKHLAMTLFVPTFNKLLKLEQEYETDDFIEKVTGRKLGWGFANDALPAREYIQGDFELVANIGMNKQVQVNKWMLLMDRANLVNQSTLAMVSAGVVQAQQVHFMDTMKMFHKILPIMGERNIEEFQIKAQTPQLPPGTSAPKGVASQTGMTTEPNLVFGNTMPENMMGGMSAS